jgi:hypothetical protein
MDALDALLLPLESGLAGHPTVVVDADGATRLRQGQLVDSFGTAPGRYIALDAEGKAVALAECRGDGRLRCQRGFNAISGAARSDI